MEKDFFNNRNKKYIMLFFTALITGSVITNLAGKDVIVKWGLFNASYIRSITSASIPFGQILYYIFRKRAGHFAFLYIGSYTTIKDKIMLIISAYLGFGMGTLISVLTIQFGIKFLPLFLIAVLIHMLLYISGIIFIYISEEGKNRRERTVKNIKGILLYLLGILCESIIYWKMLPKLLEHFF